MRKSVKTFVKRGISIALAAVMSVSLLACGNQGTTGNGKNGSGSDADSGYVYVPKFTSLEAKEGEYTNRVILQDNRMYYSGGSYNEETGESEEFFRYLDINQPETVETLQLIFEAPEGLMTSMNNFSFDGEGNLYVTWYTYQPYVEGQPYSDEGSTTYLVKYDSELNQMWIQDIGAMLTDENNSYIREIVVSKEGKLYASSNDLIYVFDSEGALVKSISTGTDWVNGIVSTEDDRIFFIQYGGKGMELVEILTDTDKLGDTLGNIPDSNGIIRSGKEGKLLIAGASKLYEYDMATQESAEILTWLECNVDGNYVQEFMMVSDEQIVIYYDNYDDDPELTVLTKTEAEKVEKKTIITLGTLYEGNSTLQRAAVAFNKSNTKYQIEIKGYIDESAEWTENTYSDGIARMNAAIVSDDCPDLIDLSYSDLNNLASKGALEDLTPYLEESTAANKSDFVESVLAAYNFGGIQVTVPKGFSIATLLGKTSVVGEKTGWTLDDVIALADAHPKAQLLHYVDKASALRICLMFASDTFIDYETATCNFNSPEFIKVLEFANRFEMEANYEESLPSMIQSGKVLLSDASFGDVQEYQMYNLMFEDETTNIGYPTFDGSAGVFISGSQLYGISTRSRNKEGAWEFLESILAKDSGGDHGWEFPSRKDKLEEVFEEAMTPEYQYDENGQIMYDGEGNPVQFPKTTWGYDDWDVEIYAATQKEIDEIKAMIDIAKPVSEGNEEIYNMIIEDASAFFEGAKSAEEVAKIIQSRVELYVSVNS